MITVYRASDRIDLKIHDVTFKIKPLTYKEKLDVSASVTNNEGEQGIDMLAQLIVLLRYCVKDVSGICYIDKTPMTLTFNEDDTLAQECVDDLLNLGIISDLATSLYSIREGIPESIDGLDGKPLKHIKIVPSQSVIPKKK